MNSCITLSTDVVYLKRVTVKSEISMADIEIEIDGKKLTAQPNQMVIQVADAAGIYIPRFCYHKHLSIAANCRMCLVEVEKSPKALPACATPVMPGMKVFTKSQKTLEAQRAVMSFLLINHPLDCPICDQGGECELQDLSMGYGATHSNYDECKRSVGDMDLGPLIATEMTRCIHCTRCVRFGEEVAGMREMGATSRGGHTEIGTFVAHAIRSEVSGNIIDLCPVGALTSKPYRFTARAFELQQAPSISPHDCLGSNLNMHTRTGEVMRVVARENAEINETWISDRDRFSYTGLAHQDRLTVPRIKINGEWQVVDWEQALEAAARGLQSVIHSAGVDAVGALASPNSTLEEHYLLQKIMRELGVAHVDHRLRESDTRDQAGFSTFPGLPMSLAEFANTDAVLLIGSNLQKEQPMAAVRLRQAVAKGAVVSVVNPVDYDFNFKVSAKNIVAPHECVHTLQTLLQALKNKDGAHPLAAACLNKQKALVLVGALTNHHKEAAVIRSLAKQIADEMQAAFGVMTDGANAAGAWLAGMVPHLRDGLLINQPGLNAHEMLVKPRKAYVLLNIDPERDFAVPSTAINALKQASTVVALSLYRNPVLEAHADVILPIASFAETAGTFVNASGQWQSFQGLAKPVGEARPAWKILRVLAHFLHLPPLTYESAEAVRDELKAKIAHHDMPKPKYTAPVLSAEKPNAGLSRVGEIPLYALDSLVRRAEPLQTAQAITEGDVGECRVHPDTLSQAGFKAGDRVKVKQGEHHAIMILHENTRIAPNAVWAAGAVDATEGLGGLFDAIVLEKA
jgi:NADH-quinone oxidoreductase subunit G